MSLFLHLILLMVFFLYHLIYSTSAFLISFPLLVLSLSVYSSDSFILLSVFIFSVLSSNLVSILIYFVPPLPASFPSLIIPFISFVRYILYTLPYDPPFAEFPVAFSVGVYVFDFLIDVIIIIRILFFSVFFFISFTY